MKAPTNGGGYFHKFLADARPIGLAAALLAILMVEGCSKPAPTPVPAVILVLMRLPVGTSLQQVDERVGDKAMQAARKVAGVQAIETVARAEELEVYVQVQSEKPVEAVRGAFEGTPLSVESKMEFAALSGPMPAVVPGVKPVLSVAIDPERAAALGISQEDADKAAAQANAQSTPEGIRAIQVKAANGQMVPLSDVAKVTFEARPDCIVDQWP